MARRFWIRWIWFVWLPVLMTGCWDQRPIEQQAVVIAMGINRHHQWTLVFPNVAVSIGSLASLPPSQQFYAETVTATSWPQAIQEVQTATDRNVSFGELQVLALDRRLVANQVAQIIDSLNAMGAIPATFWLIATPNNPASLLTRSSPQTIVPYYYLSTYFDCTACHALNLGQREWQWWDQSETPGVSPFIPVASPTPGGMAVRQVLVYPPTGSPDLMPAKATTGFAFLTGRVLHDVITVNVGPHPFAVGKITETVHTGARLSSNAVTVRVTIHARGLIMSTPPHLIVSHAIETTVSRQVAQAIQSMASEAVQWANQTRTDPFGFAKTAAWAHPIAASHFSFAALSRLPIHADITVTFQTLGEGVSR
ncbi:MAG: spore gernimation protein [Sulfobacillus sp.]|nr:spore gernimation protein [Sulfobacillus sp.]